MLWDADRNKLKPNLPISGVGSVPYFADTLKRTTELFLASSAKAKPDRMVQTVNGVQEEVAPADMTQLATTVYNDNPLNNMPLVRFKHTNVRVVNTTTTRAVELAIRAHSGAKVICHNMGRFKDPRSEWGRTIYGQEVDFLHRTTLSASLTPSVYPIPCFQAVYSRGVTIVRGDGAAGWPFLRPEERTTFDVVTMCPYTFISGAAPFGAAELAVVRAKLEVLLGVCALHGADVLVLGAFGCGGARNPPEMVAAACRSVIEEYAGFFSDIYFAVLGTGGPSTETCKIFARTLVGDDAVEKASTPLGTASFAIATDKERNHLVKRYVAEAPWVVRDRGLSLSVVEGQIKAFCSAAGRCESVLVDIHNKECFHPPHCPRGPSCTNSGELHRLLFVHNSEVWDTLRRAEAVRVAEAAWTAYHKTPKALTAAFPPATSFLPQLCLAEYKMLMESTDADERKKIAALNVEKVPLDTLLPIGQLEKRYLVRWCRAAGFRRIYDTYNCAFNADEFHRRCDGVSPTLVLIQANSELGTRVFGGYTGIPWQSGENASTSAADNNSSGEGRSFVFTLKNTNGFPPTAFPLAPNHKNVVTFEKTCGPVFGSSTIKIIGASSISSCASDDYIIPKRFNFTESQNTMFKVLGYEVFQVLSEEDVLAAASANTNTTGSSAAQQQKQQNQLHFQQSMHQIPGQPRGKSVFFMPQSSANSTFFKVQQPQAKIPTTGPEAAQGLLSTNGAIPISVGSMTSTGGGAEVVAAMQPSQSGFISKVTCTSFLRHSYTSTYFDVVDP